jgi:hypothetical protein
MMCSEKLKKGRMNESINKICSGSVQKKKKKLIG